MTRAAVNDFFPPNFPVTVDSIEVENGDTIPTAYLMDRLQERYQSTHKVYFVMGSDLLTNLHRWDDGQRIIEEMNLIVFRRKGYEEEEKDLEQHPNFLQNEPIVVGADQSLIGVISSTEIRRRVL